MGRSGGIGAFFMCLPVCSEAALSLVLRALTGLASGAPDPDHTALRKSVRSLRSHGLSYPNIATVVVFGSTWYPPDEIRKWQRSHNGMVTALCSQHGVGLEGVFFQLCENPKLDVNLLRATMELAQLDS